MRHKSIKILILSIMIISSLWIIWLSLTPIIDRDALRFHLAFAKIWAENDFLFFRPYFAFYELSMLNLNYIYMLVFKFGLPDQFTKIIHASFLIAGGYLIFKYFKKRYGFNWGALSFIFYVTIPIHQRLSSEVYVDLGLLFFTTLAIIYFLKWYESDLTEKKYLIISAIGTGLSFGTKYNGMIIAFFLTLFVGLVVAREKKNDKLAIKYMAIYVGIILILVSPWLIRNFIDSGNPLFPLFDSIIPSSIELPAELVGNVVGETMNRMVNGKEGVLSLFLLPFRVFFEGVDNNFIKFDGVLNPLMLLLLVFLFFPRIMDKQKRKKLFYLLTLFIVVYLVTLYSNSIRIRYFIPIYPMLIILNIESLKNLYSNKKLKYTFYMLSVLFIAYNSIYSVKLFKKLHIADFNPFKGETKIEYLEKYLVNYDFFEFINKHTPENSVIYEAFTGGRGYYIERTFFSDTYPLDRYLLELVKNGAGPNNYKSYFSSLPNSELRATHLLIKPNSLVHTFIDMNKDENDPENIESKKKLQGYINYIDGLKILKAENDVYLFGL